MYSRQFIFERATKNTYRFLEVLEADKGEPIVGVLYVQKSAFEKQPHRITVTIDAPNA